jgi:hypothetical protein
MIRFRFIPYLCAVVLGGILFAGAVANGVPQPTQGDALAHLKLSDDQLHFGNVESGSTTTRSEHIHNTGTVPIVISETSLHGKGFHVRRPALPFTLMPGADFPFEIVFTPELAGHYIGNFTLQYRWSGTTSHSSSRAIKVFGTAGRDKGQIEADLSFLHFGSVEVSGKKSIMETLMNRSGDALTISQVEVAGKGFSFSGINPPVTLSPGQSISFPVMFAPSLGGVASGKLAIHSNASNATVSVALGGTGSTPGRLTLNPGSINFSNVVVGSQQNRTVTLVATAGPVTVSSAGTNSNEFSISGISLPTTIAAGSSASLTLTFSPQSSGAATGILALNGSSTSSRTTASIAGTGTAPTQHSVDLAWTSSTSSDVVGYNIYRGTQSGGPYSPLTSAPETGTTETDTTVSGGQAYYYVVTAVNVNSEESVYSNEQKAVIPFP